MLRLKYILLVLAVLVVAGCGTTEKKGAEHQKPAAQQPVAQPAAPLQVDVSEPVQPSEEPSAKAKVVKSTPAIRAPKKELPPIKVAKNELPPVKEVKNELPPVKEIRTQPEPVVPQVEVPKPAVPQPVIAEVIPPAPPKPPEPRYAIIPQGTSIQVRLQQPLDSGINKTGDSFRTVLDRDIVVNGIIVAPKGTTLEGKLGQVERAGRVQGRSSMAMQLVNLIVDNQPYPLKTKVVSFLGPSSTTKDAAKVGGGAGLGALIGALAGGGKGAAIGAAVGAGAGGAAVVATRGDELQFPIEQKFSFVLQQDVLVQLK
jgi:hypothetical protein